MSNPNNCSTCDWKAHDDKGHCYMFFDAPTEVCMQHTGRKTEDTVASHALMAALFGNVLDLFDKGFDHDINEGQDKPWFRRMGIDEGKFRDAIAATDDIEAEEQMEGESCSGCEGVVCPVHGIQRDEPK